MIPVLVCVLLLLLSLLLLLFVVVAAADAAAMLCGLAFCSCARIATFGSCGPMSAVTAAAATAAAAPVPRCCGLCLRFSFLLRAALQSLLISGCGCCSYQS